MPPLMHTLATFLDPSLGHMAFVPEAQNRQSLLDQGREALRLIVSQVQPADQPASTPASQPARPPPSTPDPFDLLRNTTANPALPEAALQQPDVRLVEELKAFEARADEHDKDPLVFWRRAATKLPLMALAAKRIYMIQGSSGESERRFSCGGEIITPKRSLLAPDAVEPLIVLHEALQNGVWKPFKFSIGALQSENK